MKLKDYIENLNQFVKENPDALEMDVITSIDDEGNGYNPVYFSPSKGHFDGYEFDQDNEDGANAVCVN